MTSAGRFRNQIKRPGWDVLGPGAAWPQRLIKRLNGANTHVLTDDGQHAAIFYTKAHDQLQRPLLAAVADLPAPPDLRDALKRIDDHVRGYLTDSVPAKRRLESKITSRAGEPSGLAAVQLYVFAYMRRATKTVNYSAELPLAQGVILG